MRDFKIYVGVASALLIAFLFYQYNQPQPVDWKSSFYYGDKIPFGTYVLHERMNDIFPGAQLVNTNKSIFDEFHNDKPADGNYVIISKSVTIDKPDYTELVKYISKGNSVFISTLSINGVLADTLDLEISENIFKRKNNLATLYVNGTLKEFQFDRGTAASYFSSFDTTKATIIGSDTGNRANLLRFRFGKGSLFVCANPKLFTNYALLKANGTENYAANALSYMPAAKNIYWDEYQNGDGKQSESPMRVLLTYPALHWAYFISLFTLILFVLYELKRRQRIIPVIEPLKNSTLDFVKVVGQVYYEKRDNSNIAAKKIAYWFSYLRDRYQLKTNKLDKEFTLALAQKTGIDADFATDIVNFLNYLGVQNRVSDAELIKLNQLIEKFHTQS